MQLLQRLAAAVQVQPDRVHHGFRRQQQQQQQQQQGALQQQQASAGADQAHEGLQKAVKAATACAQQQQQQRQHINAHQGAVAAAGLDQYPLDAPQVPDG
jgi:hypothetical protein